jgi:hypothetical protein
VEHPELAAHSNTLLALTGFGFGPSQV